MTYWLIVKFTRKGSLAGLLAPAFCVINIERLELYIFVIFVNRFYTRILELKTTYSTDQELLLAMKNGDRMAWRELYQNSRKMIFSYIKENSGNQEDAADILQEGICVLLAKIKSKDFELTSKLSTFLFSICRNLWLMQLRKKGKSEKTNTIPEGQIPAEIEVVDEKEKLLQKIEKHFNELGDSCRNILTMFYYKKVSMEDIATKLGIKNSDTVKAQKYRCLKQLKSKCS